MNTDFTFTLTEKELQTIFQGLGELPAKFSIELIQKLQQEAQSQIKKEDGDGKL